MNRKLCAPIVILTLFLALFLFPGDAIAQDLKIRVAGKDASIHLKPDAESRVIQISPVGTVLDAEKKVGEWYQVKIRSRLGVILTGYIHQDYVEEITAEESEEAVTEPVGEEIPTPAPEKRASRGDIGIRFGFVSGSFLGEKSSYSLNWSENLLKSVNESGAISTKIQNPLGVGLSFSYFISGGLGLQLKLDYNLTSEIKREESQSTYTLTWSWTDGRGPFDRSKEWSVDGEFSVIPISLNFTYKMQGGGMLVPYISAGASYFFGNVKANTKSGLGITWEAEGSQYIDYVDVPLRIDESIGHFGFNVGGGLDLLLSSSFGLNVEAAYFLGKKIDQTWEPVSGTYSGNNFPDVSWMIDSATIELIRGQVDPLEVNTSFFKVQAGIKLLF